MKCVSDVFSRKGNSASLDSFIVKEFELTNGKIMVFSSVSLPEQLNFAEISAEMMLNTFKTKTDENIFSAFLSCFEEANDYLFGKQLAHGVNAAIIYVQGDNCYLGWVGDLSILLCKDGQLHLLSERQTLEEMLNTADLDSDESHHHLFDVIKTNITLGAFSQLGGTVQTLLIHPKKGDFILLANRNLHDSLVDSELEVVKDKTQLVYSINALLIDASINSPNQNLVCVSIFIEDCENTNTTNEQMFSGISLRKNYQYNLSASEEKVVQKSSNTPFYILGVVITFIVSFGVIVMLGGVDKNTDNKLITSFELGELIDPIIKSQLIHSQSDTLKIVFKGKTHEIFVTNGRRTISKTKTVPLEKHVQLVDDEKVEVIKKDSFYQKQKKIDQEENVNKEYIKDFSNEENEDSKGIDPLKQLKKKNYIHVVEKGEGFSFITKKYEKSHPNLTQKKLIEFNLKSDKFVGSRKEFEKGNLQIGMELEIPKE